MRWTVQQVNDGPAGTRSRGDSKPTRVKTKELASVWHHDIKNEISRAHPLLRDQGETLYILIMCFATNCLSSVTLDVGTRSQHAHQPGAFVFLRRPYNLKITVSATNVVSSAVATILVALGTESGLPYLYVPWLANTARGMAFREGPALLGIAYTLLPNADLPSTSFLFMALLLYELRVVPDAGVVGFLVSRGRQQHLPPLTTFEARAMHAGDHGVGRNGSGGYYHKPCCLGRSTENGSNNVGETLCCCCTCTATASPSLLTSLGVCILVLAYTLVGAFTFMALEGGLQSDSSAVISLKSNPEDAAAIGAEIRSRTVEKLWSITEDLNILYRDNWTRLAAQEVLDFQDTLVRTLAKQSYKVLPVTKTQQHTSLNHRWTFSSSLLYSLTLITTIGYGGVAPKTLWGRLITIVYALIGIPLMLVYLSTVGDVLARSFRRLYGRLCRPRNCTRKPTKTYHNHVESKSAGNYYPSKDSSCDDLGRAGSVVLLDCGSEGLQAASSSTALDPGSKRHHRNFHHSAPCPEAVRIPITLCLLIIVAYIGGGAVLFNKLEGWSLQDGSYFCFTSLGTIGFGDLVPGGTSAPSPTLQELSLCACSLYILVGMGLIAMCFNLVQEEVVHVVRAVGKFCGMGGSSRSGSDASDCRGAGNAGDEEGIAMSVVSTSS